MGKKYKLKTWVKVTLFILFTISVITILILFLMKGENDFEKLARQCDEDRGYTCSYYEVRQYSLGK